MANLATRIGFPAVLPIRLSRFVFTGLCMAGFAAMFPGEVAAAPAEIARTPASAALPVPSPEFLSYWKSGLAELSSYAVTTSRYGESRRAQGVMVFVYEEIDDRTRIKVESDRVPLARRVPVLKLNNVLKFNTGIYDYSVMTSVFAGLTGPGVTRPFDPRKVSFSSQEWCGNVYHQVLPRPDGLVSTLHSYFESEGDAETVLPYPKETLYYEDEMAILLRELDGAFLKTGESRRIDLVPSLWGRRKRHLPLAFLEATLTKVGPETFTSRSGPRRAIKWTLAWKGHAMAYHVEADAPRKLLAWDDGKGEKGELVASVRKTYWERNRNEDEPLRKELGLTYGVGSGE